LPLHRIVNQQNFNEGGNMFDVDKGWIAIWNCDKIKLPDSLNSKVLHRYRGITIVDNGLHKFASDEIALENNGKVCWMDGFVFNKSQLVENNNTRKWDEAFLKETEKENFPCDLRGGFAGFISEDDEVLLFNDHVGNHAVYYYCQNEILICSSRVYYIIELLKYNKAKITFNIQAAHYMIEQGFMIDDSTFAEEIRRVLPGHTVKIRKNGQAEIHQYYQMDNQNIKRELTEDQAVELIDQYFRQAVKREYDKDKEYGYEHLTDLSGGLDSRMTSWVAHDLGYINQMNVTCCKQGYLDFKIAQKIAIALRHSFLYMSLDDFNWYQDAEEMARKNNGASLYAGMTGGNRLYRVLDKERFGIVHTGMVGDAIIGYFFKEAKEGYEQPCGHEKTYSTKIQYGVNNAILQKYKNKELYALYVRGLLGAQTSYFTIQTYFETCSPFLDVDFLDMMLTIPAEMRCGHYIYFKWLEKKYPLAAEVGWEKWKGLKPKIKNINRAEIWKKCYRKFNRIKMKLCKSEPQHIHPTDYWYEKNENVRKWTEKYFEEKIHWLHDFPVLMKDIEFLFKEGDSIEKTQALTVLIWAEFLMKTYKEY